MMELKEFRDQLKARAEEARGKGDHFMSEQLTQAITTIAMLESRVAALRTTIISAKREIENFDVTGALNILTLATQQMSGVSGGE